MVDEIAPAAPAAPVASVEGAPASSVVASTNIADTTSAAPAVSTETAAPSDTAKPETVVADAQAKAAKPETLLANDVKTEEKPAEAKTEVKVDEKPAEVKTETLVETPKYELKLPEGVTVDEAKVGDFTKMLGDFETTAKVPHDEVQKLGQQMFDRHIEAMQRYTESLTQAWNKQKNDWKDSFLKSPEFANRTDTVLNSAIDVINTYGGTSEQQKEFRDLMESSGIGNHPAMIRMLSNVKLGKPEPKQLAAPTISTPAKRSKIETMYGKKSA